MIAQTENEAPISRVYLIEGYIGVSDRVGQIDRHYPDIYFDVGGAFLFQLQPEQPSFLGVEYNFTPLQSYDLQVYDAVEDFYYDYTTSTSSTSLFTLYRHYMNFRLWKMEPYVEGKLGLVARLTTTSISSPDDTEYYEFDFDNFDANVGYGFAAGVHFPVNDYIFITAKVAYQSTLSGTYHVLDNESQAIYSSLEAFSKKSGTSDVIRYDLGVTFAF